MIHFQCPSCASPFEVDDRLAGRAGRCKVCGGRMKIPSNGAVAAPAAAGKPRRQRPLSPPRGGRPAADPGGGLGGFQAPAVDGRRPAHELARRGDQPGGPGADQHAGPEAAAGRQVCVGGRAVHRGAVQARRRTVAARDEGGGRQGRGGHHARVSREHGQGPEALPLDQPERLPRLRPVPDVLLLGLATGSHSLMVLGATAVIVLNIGRIVAGVANLVVIPFRESPIQGVLFLIPPITFFYMYQNWHKVHRPVKRIVGPILTIAMVAAAFVAEPWIGAKARRKARSRTRSSPASAP